MLFRPADPARTMNLKRTADEGLPDTWRNGSSKKSKTAEHDEDFKDARHLAKKSIDDLVKLAVAKEELKGKKKKREKLKNKKKMRKLLETESPNPSTSGHSIKSLAKQQKLGDSTPRSTMTGSKKVELLESNKQAKVKKFGSWFPTAFTVKGDGPKVDADEISIALFYQYVEPAWSETRKQQVFAVSIRTANNLIKYWPLQLLQFVIDKGAELALGGRARIACEGVNCTISGTQVAIPVLPSRPRHSTRARIGRLVLCIQHGCDESAAHPARL